MDNNFLPTGNVCNRKVKPWNFSEQYKALCTVYFPPLNIKFKTDTIYAFDCYKSQKQYLSQRETITISFVGELEAWYHSYVSLRAKRGVTYPVINIQSLLQFVYSEKQTVNDAEKL